MLLVFSWHPVAWKYHTANHARDSHAFHYKQYEVWNHQLSVEKTDLMEMDTNIDCCPCNISPGAIQIYHIGKQVNAVIYCSYHRH
jgi:hypothetical protein